MKKRQSPKKGKVKNINKKAYGLILVEIISQFIFIIVLNFKELVSMMFDNIEKG